MIDKRQGKFIGRWAFFIGLATIGLAVALPGPVIGIGAHPYYLFVFVLGTGLFLGGAVVWISAALRR